MRAGRETAVLLLAALLTGMLMTLISYRFGAQRLIGLEVYLTLGLVLLLIIGLLLVWCRLAGTVAGTELPSATAGAADRPGPPSQAWHANSPAPAMKGAGGIREDDGSNSFGNRAPSAGGERQANSGSPSKNQKNPNPPPAPRLQPDPGSQPTPWTGLDSPAHSRFDPSRLIDIWDGYFSDGDGQFNVSGLRRQIEKAGIDAKVIPGEQMGGGDSILGVELQEPGGFIHLLPNFTKSPRALAEWFNATESGPRTARIQRLVRPAVAKKSGGSITLTSKGEVE